MPSANSQIPKGDDPTVGVPHGRVGGLSAQISQFLASQVFGVYRLPIGDCRYDRYWTGRTAWSEVFRNSRTFSRLIWLHVPPILRPGSEGFRDQEAVRAIMAEKVIALDLVQA